MLYIEQEKKKEPTVFIDEVGRRKRGFIKYDLITVITI
jgi:hypothetical protein